MSRIAYCTARTHQQADAIVQQLREHGFLNNDISVLMQEHGKIVQVTGDPDETHAADGTIAGAGGGAVLGGALGWLAGIGMVALPGLGAFIAAGPIAAALTGLAIGGTVGGLAGALIGLGIPQEEAHRYVKHIEEGASLISVHSATEERNDEAKRIFAAGGGENIHCVPAADNAFVETGP